MNDNLTESDALKLIAKHFNASDACFINQELWLENGHCMNTGFHAGWSKSMFSKTFALSLVTDRPANEYEVSRGKLKVTVKAKNPTEAGNKARKDLRSKTGVIKVRFLRTLS